MFGGRWRKAAQPRNTNDCRDEPARPNGPERPVARQTRRFPGRNRPVPAPGPAPPAGAPVGASPEFADRVVDRRRLAAIMRRSLDGGALEPDPRLVELRAERTGQRRPPACIIMGLPGCGPLQDERSNLISATGGQVTELISGMGREPCSLTAAHSVRSLTIRSDNLCGCSRWSWLDGKHQREIPEFNT